MSDLTEVRQIATIRADAAAAFSVYVKEHNTSCPLSIQIDRKIAELKLLKGDKYDCKDMIDLQLSKEETNILIRAQVSMVKRLQELAEKFGVDKKLSLNVAV